MKLNLKTKLAFACTLVALGMSPASWAQLEADADVSEDDDDELEELVIVGSHLPRDISDAPSPITAITELDIELSGIENVADLLRQSSYNSTGSFRERSGTSFGQIALIDLRGLGPSRTAVLIDGRRVPGSPFTGTSAVDLNTFPLASIERIEILRDSASAIYGADAIGGVINVVMKDNYTGWQIEAGAEMPTREGAASDHLNALWGTNFDGGSIMVGFENYARDSIADKDRDYSKAQFAPGDSFSNTVGVSVGGNTGFSPRFPLSPFVVGDCPSDLYAGTFLNPFGLAGEGCGFAYANISLQTGNLERQTIFSRFHYDLGDTAELYLDARLSNNSTFGRYAPAVGFFGVNGGDEPSHPNINGGNPFDAFHRFVGHGNRDDSVDLTELTLIGGVEGELSGGIGYDAGLQIYSYDALNEGNTYISQSGIVVAVAEGRYDLFNPLSTDPVHLAAVAETGLRLTRDIFTDYSRAYATFDGKAFAIGDQDALWAAGLETSTEDYQDRYDQWREAVDVLGSAGNSAAGDRQVFAMFGELALPLRDNWDLIVAARYDDYSDFGQSVSPQVSTRYRFTDAVAIRASSGSGFKAPNLTSLYQSLSQSFESITDTYRCDLQEANNRGPWNPQIVDNNDTPNDRSDDFLRDKTDAELANPSCGSFQIEEFTGGNPDLDAEKSDSFNIGVVLDIGIFSGSVDFYQIDLADAVGITSRGAIPQLEREGRLPTGVVVTREEIVDDVTTPLIDETYDTFAGDPGPISGILNAYTNTARLEVGGLDFVGDFQFESQLAKYGIGVQWSHVLGFKQASSDDDSLEDQAGSTNGDTGHPRDRINLNFRMNMKSLTVSYSMNYISAFDHPDSESGFPAWTGHDVTVNWQDAFSVSGLTLSAGILNFTDEDPSLLDEGLWSNIDQVVYNLYPLAGSVPFVTFKYNFDN